MNSITHEIINYQSNIPIKLFYQRIGDVPKHWHSSIEILFVLSGEMCVSVEDARYQLKEDELLLINPHHIHETHSADCSLIVVQIRLSEFGLNWAIPENIQFCCNSSMEEMHPDRYFRLKHLIVMLLKNNSAGGEFSQLSNYTYAIQLIQELCAHYKTNSPAPSPHSIKYLNRLKSILDYLNQNFSQEITLVDIASREYLTPAYLSHFFEKTMGTTLFTYLTRIRLNHAVFDLVTADASIETIAEKNGFSSARAFSTVFIKYYEMRPSEYRKLNKQKENFKSSPDLADFSLPYMPIQQNSYLELERYDFLDKLAPYIHEYGQLSPTATPAAHYESRSLGTISVPSALSNKYPLLTSSFKCFCGVSRASELLLPNVRDMVVQAQKDIGFEYIKFHGILDDDLQVCTHIQGEDFIPDFTYVDMVLDFILKNHLKPMIQLSFMPRALAKDPENQIFQKPVIISEPKDDDLWCRLITKFTNHLLQRYSIEQVKDWIFTFWNETLNKLSFDFKDPETFLRLYQLTRRCVKACHPGLRFASTSYSALEFPEMNYDIFLDYARENNCLPDIFIFHFYPVVTDNNAFSSQAAQWKAESYTAPVALSRDKDVFGKFLDAISQKLPEADHIPIYITEWNFSPSHREWLNDTCYSACYIVRNLLLNNTKATGFCHWCLTDLHQELPMPSRLFHGGMGLFTRNQIPKPSYYAYLFLNRLYPMILHQEEGCIVTTDGSHFAILLYHYYHFNNLYGHGISFDTTHENWENAFPDAKPLSVTFTLQGLAAKRYLQTQTFISPDSGSAFEQWIAMGSPDICTKEDAAYLKARSVPTVSKEKIAPIDGGHSCTCLLKPHEIRLILLQSE